MATAVVTGGAGFLGSHLCEALLARGHRVVCLDNLETGSLENIRHLNDMEHVRTRPGMYIGKLGDGSCAEDGIYVLLKEVIDNSIDEFKMQAGKKIEISVEENLRVSVRDYGRGIPQGKLIEAVSVLNTGGKYDSKAFKKSVGLNGVGVKAVNALSARFTVRNFDGADRLEQRPLICAVKSVGQRSTPGQETFPIQIE